MEEFDRFLADLRPVVDQMYAEHLLRPLESGCFELTEIPDAVLAEIFTLPRLNTIFLLVLRGLDWTTDKATALAQDLRPVIPTVTETVEAGTLRLEIRIDGQHPGERPGPGTIHPVCTCSSPARILWCRTAGKYSLNCWACSRFMPVILKLWHTAIRASM